MLVCGWKERNRGGGTRCEEGVSIKGQSGEYRLRIHLVSGSVGAFLEEVICVCKVL